MCRTSTTSRGVAERCTGVTNCACAPQKCLGVTNWCKRLPVRGAKKRIYRPINPSLISDFVIAMMMQEQHLRAVLAPNAICFEQTLEQGSLELAMRTRVAIRSLNALTRERRFLNPFKYRRFAWQLWSHKVLRYASPLLWLGALASNMALAGETFYLVLFCFQTALLAAGSVGFLLQGQRRDLGLFGQPCTFSLANVAALIATLRYLRGDRIVAGHRFAEAGTACGSCSAARLESDQNCLGAARTITLNSANRDVAPRGLIAHACATDRRVALAP